MKRHIQTTLSDMYYAKEDFINQTRIVFLDEQKAPVELFVLRKADVSFSDIYQARIIGKAPDQKSYFADIGQQRTVFIKTKNNLREGQLLTVQIQQEEKLDKIAAARLLNEQRDVPVGLLEKAPLPDTSDKTELPWSEEIEEAFENILEPIVNFANGARLIFERTHAFWSIDVDSGKSTQSAKDINKKAVSLIAKEIIKRNLSGNILVDFIGYKKKTDLKEFIPIFKEYLSKSDIPFSIVGISPIGNFEIRRDRQRACLLDSLSSPSALAYQFFKKILKAKASVTKACVSSLLYKTLNTQLAEDWEKVQKKNGQEIKLNIQPQLEGYQI